MRNTRSSSGRKSRSRAARGVNCGSEENDISANDQHQDEVPQAPPVLNEAGRRRAELSRSIAEREASRLARPERRPADFVLPHASKSKSAVTSTPTGAHMSAPVGGARREADEWCGPFSVARRMIAQREEARAKREAEIRERRGVNRENNEERHPLDDAIQQLELEKECQKHPSMRWRGNIVVDDENDGSKENKNKKKDNLYLKRKKRIQRQQLSKRKKAAEDNADSDVFSTRVPKLFQICVDFLVANFEAVECLGDRVDSSIRRKLCEALVARGKMNAGAFDALAEVGVESLEVIDCAQITQDQLSNALSLLIPGGLSVLILGHAGRCFGPKAVKAIVEASTPPDSSLDEDTSTPAFIPSPTFDTGIGSEYSTSLITGITGTAMNKKSSSLFALSIGGAYLLQDTDAAMLIDTVSHTLGSIEFTACPLLGSELCRSIIENYSMRTSSSMSNKNASAPLLELALHDLELSTDDLLSMGKSKALSHLRSLKLRSVSGLNDEAIEAILLSTAASATGGGGGGLEGIDLGQNPSLTDRTLASIRRCNVNGALRSLNLSGLKGMTMAGFLALFTRNIDGMKEQPPVLRTLDVSNCAVGVVTDDVIRLVVSAASIASTASTNSFASTVTKATVLEEDEEGNKEVSDEEHETEDQPDQRLAKRRPTVVGPGRGLVYLNFSGAPAVTDHAMELVAETCAASLRELDVSFCPSISDRGLGHLVSVVGKQLRTIRVWGCAQITDEFLDGHDRIDDGGLDIIGVWMKKSGARALR